MADSRRPARAGQRADKRFEEYAEDDDHLDMMDEDDDSMVYCSCQQPDRGQDDYVQCSDGTKGW
jgi:hypothetical protein